MIRGFFFFALILVLAGCTDPASKLPTYYHVPQFHMVDSYGHPFDSSVLKGKVWVADFIYTSCPGACPLMTAKMHTLQRQFAGNPNVDFVSMSVDPQNDTPAALTKFAHQFGGPAKDWLFLRGTPETVHYIAHDVFKVADLITRMDHSTKFILVDKRGDIRGFYSSLDEEDTPKLIADTKALAKQRL